MHILDTNHLSELGYNSTSGARLRSRLDQLNADAVTTVISVEEELGGWLAKVNKCRESDLQIHIYGLLTERVNFLARWTVLQIDSESLAQFRAFRKQGIRIGTQDLKIACIALAHDATVLTRNLVDFQQVSGLRVENWLD
ncbi:MAG: type II toxin-antitoxin system VapC family toxin [Verrucomicrobiaceae bacterium]|nr:type II toxin-antitoxin system VapC family toxin [Verrucomicrobiaceae bacterium]